TMTCAGLLGLATGIGRREERRLPAGAPKGELGVKSSGPGFVPPPRPNGPRGTGPKLGAAMRDAAAPRGVAFLGGILNKNFGRLPGPGGVHHLYFMWSLERVGVVYGADWIGGIDWYAAGAEYLVRVQNPDGSWSLGSNPVDTAFAVLFLSK